MDAWATSCFPVQAKGGADHGEQEAAMIKIAVSEAARASLGSLSIPILVNSVMLKLGVDRLAGRHAGACIPCFRVLLSAAW
jgi:hypothetical protein